ncbi:serine/threonine protein kinase [Aquirufa sp.]|jgi:serine/threonine-protein kinase|uniref:serine/threonine protein kinase n=1 Tax=Aquirufa sp. TaxID=2676249 RepID=UPI0037BEC633
MRLGQYDTIETLSEGASGIVYLAVDTYTGFPVAIKVLRQSFHSNAVALDKFQFEANQYLYLNHQNIVTLKGFNFNPPYLVMEYIEGNTLDEYVKKNYPKGIPQALAIQIMIQIADAIHYAHMRQFPVLHLDLKPANIMIKPDGNIKVIDFGISRNTTQINPSMFVGSPYYMSPEQVNNANVTQLSDIYSLGVTLFYLLKGKAPFDPKLNIDEVFAKKLDGELEGIGPANFPVNLANCIKKATQVNPIHRYPTCLEFKKALISLL